MRKRKTLTSLLFFLISLHLSGQNILISGKVTDLAGEAIPGASVFIKGTSTGTATDFNGSFALEAGKKDILIFSGIGFQNHEVKLEQIKRPEQLNIRLKESTTELKAVQVFAKSEATEIREQAYAVEVVESKGFKNLSTNANDILSKISGVNIRQSGGLGSQFSVSLNGLSGNQLRVFLDGVPMDYFGSSLSLNNFSANLIERVEVYKGVVPIHLSSDALGGAINVTTGQRTNSFVDASYSTGSFGTQIASANGQYRNQKSGYTVRLKSFYNTTRSDYKVPVNLVDRTTGKEADEPTWVRRFHDGYLSKMVWAETGFVHTTFADQLLIGLMYSENHKELQQQANAIGQAKIPYGEVAEQEDKIIANFSFEKSGLLKDRLSIRTYAVGVFSEKLSIDTSSYRYDWYGNRELKSNTSTGEIENRKTLFTRSLTNYLANINAEYAISSQQSLAFNYSLNRMELQGSDPFKAANNTQFGQPSTVRKQVAAGSYSHNFISGKLKTTAFAKAYNYYVSSLETNYSGTDLLPFEETKNRLGFGFTATYQFINWQIKASYENATRLPELIELFGDGLNNEPSPTLLPEQSHNYNLGFIYRSQSFNRLLISVNGFVRDAKNFILPQVKGIKTYHINNGMVIAKGIDFASSFSINEQFVFTLNGTYLDKRDNNPWRNGAEGVPNSQYKIRVPNEPFLFGNLTASYRKQSLVREDDSFAVTATENFVEEFYYRWENLASKDKGTVPSQWTTNLDFVYSIKDEMCNFSFGIANLWNTKVYDNYYQLRPGRTYNLKFRYFFNQ